MDTKDLENDLILANIYLTETEKKLFSVVDENAELKAIILYLHKQLEDYKIKNIENTIDMTSLTAEYSKVVFENSKLVLKKFEKV